MIEIKEIVDAENEKCECANKHVPAPHSLFLIDYATLIYLCPTTYYNVVSLLGEYETRGWREPPGNVRKHYSEYVQKIAKLYVVDKPKTAW